VINWIEKETREYCHVNHCDVEVDGNGFACVLVVYFGGEEGSYDELYPIEDFFQNHDPEGFHS
jgi:hypothetical protein